MRRIYEDFAYGDGPVAECYWDTTIARPARAAPVSGVSTAIALPAPAPVQQCIRWRSRSPWARSRAQRDRRFRNARPAGAGA